MCIVPAYFLFGGNIIPIGLDLLEFSSAQEASHNFIIPQEIRIFLYIDKIDKRWPSFLKKRLDCWP